MKKRRFWLVLVILLGMMAAGFSYWLRNQMRYEIIEIPLPVGFNEPYSVQLNDAGAFVTIMNSLSDNSQHIFSWNRDIGFNDLGNLGIDGQDIGILDINNAGQFVGIYSVPSQLVKEADQLSIKPRQLCSFFYDPQIGLRNIPPTPGRIMPWATAINNLGQVAGMDHTPPDNNGNISMNLFLWTLDGETEDLKAPGFPQDINDSGHIVGETFRPNNGFFWSRKTGQILFGIPATSDRFSAKINNADQVIGLCGPDLNQCRPFRWDVRRGFRPFGQRNNNLSNVTDITDDGGYCLWIRRSWKLPFELGEGQKEQSIVAIPGRSKTNLNRLFGKSGINFIAADMNNNGWILGITRDKQSNQFRDLILLVPTNYPKSK